ncbi:DUF5694 domain-containing protein [Polaribacter porphyrae]|uniref:Uncharacterized protein n=1 Tax=Polaribacter porphyrae TaxID=1137780 RepID=A0A2S7WSH8_9FLAO|nr:DUF5694 domain-containing protein [Polaribacter porphyrae]PQJ80548.1 hypothetical protein BTO18_15795 [Polaribacter porphyrae]
MKNSIFIFVLSFLVLACNQEQKKTKKIETSKAREVLLIGTFHYNNPGKDVTKTKSFDILKEKYQLELQQISSNIKKYNPTKIFVEWPYDEQNELDSLFKQYTNGEYFNNDSLSDFYMKNEIFQLAFKVAKDNSLQKVYGIDYSTEFPFEEVMSDIENSKQSKLQAQIQEIFNWAKKIDNKIEAGISLTELTYYINSKEFRSYSNNWHNNLMLLAGKPNDFSGPYLTSEWYKRNLYMWSLIQKNSIDSDEKIMVLLGGSHAAMIELFIKGNSGWKVKELEQIMEK